MKNVGKSDRSVRIVIGVLIAVAGIYFKSWWGIVAILPLVTAFTGFCPFYKVLGITTRKTVVE